MVLKYKDVTKMSKDDILKNINDRQKDIVAMKFKIVSNKLKDVNLINKTKKEIAMMLTQLTIIEKGSK